MKKIIIIGCGSFIGGAARYIISVASFWKADNRECYLPYSMVIVHANI